MSKTIIYQNQTGILLRKGVIVKTLSAGVHKTHRFKKEQIEKYPTYVQSQAYTINVNTAEAAAIAIEVTMGVTITDAEKLFLGGENAFNIVRQAVAKQLQEVAGAKTLTELLESTITLDEVALAKAVAKNGLETVIELQPKVRLPRNLQNAIDAQEVARQRAKAELEEARGRSAVIRHYANVAKVTKENPDLLRLLLGQKAKSINVAFDANEKGK